MNAKPFYRLDAVSVLEVQGADATTIVHNLTTNEVKSLDEAAGRETFVTDVRGKTLGHVMMFRTANGLRMIGPKGQSNRIAEHADRYTIREDAVPVIHDDEFEALVFPSESNPNPELPFTEAKPHQFQLRNDKLLGDLFQSMWLGPGTVVALVSKDQVQQTLDRLESEGYQPLSEDEFHRQRVSVGFPWYGVDLDETNLPQEADRDEIAVSFTKGCYLGQETVARLDALGQVQKKLVRWSVVGTPEVGTKLTVDEKVVGRLTSVAPGENQSLAIGFARRSHFEPGSTASATIESTGKEVVGTVL
jgi:folate-binding protein YgfZ